MAMVDPFGYGTHEVLNQAPALADYDACTAMIPPCANPFDLQRRMGRAACKRGRQTGWLRARARAGAAGRPELRTHDRWGNRIDQIEFTPHGMSS